MSYVAGASSGGAIAAAIANAVKASGAIVEVEPLDFRTLIDKAGESLVVTSGPSFFSRGHKYIFGYKGLVFYTKSPTPLELPPRTDIIAARKIWVPSL